MNNIHLEPEHTLIEFKGTTLPVLAITLRSLDLQALAQAGNRLFGDGDFFDGDLAILDLGYLESQPEKIEWALILDLLSSHGLRVLGITRATENLTQSAQAVGLTPVTLGAGRTPKSQPTPASQPATAPPPPAESTIRSSENVHTLIIDRPLRSGQQVYAKGGDLVILAAVNPGAEVIADGNIHVYAPLRGRALAGALGNTQARIFTTVFTAELVSIAGIYRTFDEGVPLSLTNQPVQVRLSTENTAQPGSSAKSKIMIDILRVD